MGISSPGSSQRTVTRFGAGPTNLSKTFDKSHRDAVRDLPLEAQNGETLVLLESSGRGYGRDAPCDLQA